MSTQLQGQENLIIQTSSAPGKSNMRSRPAFFAVFFSRILISTAKDPIKEMITSTMSRCSSYTSIHAESEAHYSSIDRESLSKLVEEENLDQLESLGGVDGIVVALRSHSKNGIIGDYEDVNLRQQAHGSNTYKKPPPKSLLYFVWKALKDPMIILLILSAAFSLSFGTMKHGLGKGLSDGGSIILAVSVVVFAYSVSNFWPNKQFNRLSLKTYNIKVNVFRNGWRQSIPIDQIVVGDVVCLSIGDKIPADGLLLYGHASIVKSSQSINSDLIEVNCIQRPFLHAGSMVVDGYAQMLVTSVGMNTTWSKTVSSKWKDSQETTPLQVRLHIIASITSKVGLLVAFFVFLVWCFRYFMGRMENGYIRGKTDFHEVVYAIVGVLTIVVAIAAGAVAEGLPLAILITLAYSMKSMTNNQAFVRKHSACEAIASATTICVKLNRMQVTKFWVGKDFIERGGLSQVSPKIIELLHQAVGLHTTQPPSKASSFIWTPIEKAVICWAIQETGMNVKELAESCNILHGAEFDLVKTRGWFLMENANDNTVHVHWKGTPEAILAMCSKYYTSKGNVKAIDEDAKVKMIEVVQSMTIDGLQCIAFPHKTTSSDLFVDGTFHQMLEDARLTLIGLVGVKDLCQPGFRKAIVDCQDAGVNIKMVTRDDALIARAIATECGILKSDNCTENAVVEGEEFQQYTPEERMAKVDEIRVVARASPVDMLLAIKSLQEKGHVVAVIGNDTMDAAALREADIGICLGHQATDVAKESSDIVISNDDFISIVNVLKWGRTMFDHIQIFTQFQVTVTITSLVIDFVNVVSASQPPTIKIVASISSGEVPFAALQVLWVKLIIGTLAALALSIGQPSKKLINCPVNRKPLITNIMWRNISAQAIYHIAILLIIQFKGNAMFRMNDKVKDTLMYNTFILCQVFNQFNAREPKKKNIFKRIHKNKLFLSIIGSIIVLQIVMVEFLKRFAGTERLNWGQWGASIGFAAMSWPIAWYVKWIPVPSKPFLSYLKWRL